MIILFLDSFRSFSRLGLSKRFSELEFSVKSLRSSAVFGGRLKRPSPCRIRFARGRDRVRRLSEKCANFYIWAVYARAILGSWHIAELERKKHMGKHLFPSWHHFQIQFGFLFRPHHTFFMVTPRSVWPIVVRLLAVSMLFDIGFHG